MSCFVFTWPSIKWVAALLLLDRCSLASQAVTLWGKSNVKCQLQLRALLAYILSVVNFKIWKSFTVLQCQLRGVLFDIQDFVNQRWIRNPPHLGTGWKDPTRHPKSKTLGAKLQEIHPVFQQVRPETPLAVWKKAGNSTQIATQCNERWILQPVHPGTGSKFWQLHPQVSNNFWDSPHKNGTHLQNILDWNFFYSQHSPKNAFHGKIETFDNRWLPLKTEQSQISVMMPSF